MLCEKCKAKEDPIGAHPDGVRPVMQRASHSEGTSEMTRATGSLQTRWEAVGVMGIGSGGLSKDSDLFIVEETRGHCVDHLLSVFVSLSDDHIFLLKL